MSWEQHSKVYLDTPEPLARVVERVRLCVGGALQVSGATGLVLEVYVDENDERDDERAENCDEGFLFYPFLLDVDAMPGVSAAAYRQALNALLQALAQPGWRIVTAADDEPALWSGGRWDRLERGGS